MTKKEINRIINHEVIADCYDDHEVNMSWYRYVTEGVIFPFTACVPIKLKGVTNMQNVDVIGFQETQETYNGGEFHAEVTYEGFSFNVPLSKLENVQADQGTLQVLEVYNFEWTDD